MIISNHLLYNAALAEDMIKSSFKEVRLHLYYFHTQNFWQPGRFIY